MRARAAARSTATRREVEQSIARFEKRLDEANDALKALGGHLGSGARGSYKEVTAGLTALRRSAVKTNKEALKEFDKLRAAVTKTNASGGSSSRTKRSSSSSASSRSGSRSTTARKPAARKPAARKAASRSTSSRSTATRSRAKKS